MKFGIATGLTAWRDWRGIEGAIKDRNAGHLGGQIATALMFALSLFMGSPYAKYFAWITPEVANELGGVLAAGAAALFGWGHLSGNGVVAAVAASDRAAGRPPEGQQGPLAAPLGSAGTDAIPAAEVRAGPDPANPASGYLPG
jgi:hypothetical protein